MVLIYGHLVPPGAFPYKVPTDIDFTDEAVVQCGIPVVQIILYVLVIYKWSQINFDWITYVPFLDSSFSFLRSWSI